MSPRRGNTQGKEMYPEFVVEDFINLANYHIYLKLMIDGKLFTE